jgi:hypothetical protein
MQKSLFSFVIPANAGIHVSASVFGLAWTPACAGVTKKRVSFQLLRR